MAPHLQPREFVMPGALGERAQQWLEGRVGEIAPARPASTVMLVRDAAAGVGVEVFMLRRVPTMAFAPNMMVFPGGGVDERDADPHLPWAGPTAAEWAQVVGRPEEVARELVVAAAREVFEECGVLLAGAGPDEVVADLTAPQWDDARARLLAREVSFAQLLIEAGLVLRTDLLRVHAHWVTPEFEPRRYDTLFFAAVVPAGQVPDDRTSEAAVAGWERPERTLQEAAAGRAAMLPPTLVCLEHLARAREAAAFVRDAPPLARVMPVPGYTDDGRAVMRCDLPTWGRP